MDGARPAFFEAVEEPVRIKLYSPAVFAAWCTLALRRRTTLRPFRGSDLEIDRTKHRVTIAGRRGG